MGAVETKRGNGFWDRGSYISTIEKCVYCDKCGSFKISKQPTFQVFVWIILAVLIAIIFAGTDNTEPIFVGILCLLFLFWVLSAANAFTSGYTCLKCGNTDITMSNVLNYPENDTSIMDTGYQSAMKIYVASDIE